MRYKKYAAIMLLVLGTFVFASCGNTAENESSEEVQSSEESEETEESGEEEENKDLWTMSQKDLEILGYNDDPEACYVLGVRAELGTDEQEQNFDTAAAWYQTGADQDNAACHTALGYLYYRGAGVQQSNETAKEQFTQALNLGDTSAQAGLARVLLSEDAEGNAAAVLAYAQNGYTDRDPDGMLLYAECLRNGTGTDVNVSQAVTVYTELTELEPEDVSKMYAVNEACTELALMYISGTEVEADTTLAKDYLDAAADRGYAKALYYTGQYYEEGLGGSTDYSAAMDAYLEAAEMDYAPAQSQIGYMYFHGYGVDVDLEQAVYYQKLAATQGYAVAQVNLGYMYENGYGVETDLSAALEYYNLALAQGYAGAEEAVARVTSLLAAE